MSANLRAFLDGAALGFAQGCAAGGAIAFGFGVVLLSPFLMIFGAVGCIAGLICWSWHPSVFCGGGSWREWALMLRARLAQKLVEWAFRLHVSATWSEIRRYEYWEKICRWERHTDRQKRRAATVGRGEEPAP